MAAKATEGGVSNQNVDPDYIAPAGVPVENAMEQGIPDQGDERERTQLERAQQDEKQTSRALDEKRAERDQREQDSQQDTRRSQSNDEQGKDGAGRNVGISGSASAEVTPAKKAAGKTSDKNSR